MPLTVQARRLLDRFAEVGVEPFDRMSVLQARAMVDASVSLQGEPEDVGEVRDVLADGAIPVRLYHPAGGDGRLLVYLHGGGFVTGNVRVADAPCRALANATGRVVASVEYRLSPETPYPGPAEDCYAAVRWLADRFARPVLVGDSAGGNLVAAVTLMARDRGGPEIAGQVLMYPTLAPMARGAQDEGHGLTSAEMEWFWAHYLRDGDGEYAAPLRAADLSGLPGALIVVGEFDVLRDEGLAYAERLRDAGVAVETLVYPGMIHGFFWMARVLDEGRDVRQVIARWLP